MEDILTQNTLVDQAEMDACETARNSESRIVWQQYKQSFQVVFVSKRQKPFEGCGTETDGVRSGKVSGYTGVQVAQESLCRISVGTNDVQPKGM